MKSIMAIIVSVRTSWSGLLHAFARDKSFRLEILVGFPVYLLLAYILAPLTPLEWIIFAGSYVAILVVELINTSIEKLLDRLHPEKHELIAHSKDIASGAVLLTFLFAGAIVLALYFTHRISVFEGGYFVLGTFSVFG